MRKLRVSPNCKHLETLTVDCENAICHSVYCLILLLFLLEILSIMIVLVKRMTSTSYASLFIYKVVFNLCEIRHLNQKHLSKDKV